MTLSWILQLYMYTNFSRHSSIYKHAPTVRIIKPLTKLLDVAKPLKLRGVNYTNQQWVEHKGSMDGIIEQLCVNMHDQWGISLI